MVWIPGGPLVAGTPPDVLPRMADREMPGEQLVLKPFFIDRLPFPNEPGALPVTGLSREDARGRCEELGKRLCSELEWERACKGPDNLPYPYGTSWQAARCGPAGRAGLRPNGFLTGCVSGFGVADLVGGIYEWTDSPWGRDEPRPWGTLRGGNDANGALGTRCVHATPRAPERQGDDLGFRCCAGERNAAEVTLSVTRGEPLEVRAKVDRDVARALFAMLREEQRRTIAEPERFVFDRQWVWRPSGNEQLVVIGGCSGFGVAPSCGVLVGRVSLARSLLLGWVPSERYAPVLQQGGEPRVLWLFGGDAQGTYRRFLRYDYGDVVVGEREREIPRPKKNKPRRSGSGGR